MTEYKGTYSQYLENRRRDEIRLRKVAHRESEEIDRLQRLVDKFHAKKNKAAFANSMETRIERIQANRTVAPKHERQLHVRFPPPPAAGRTVLEVTGLAKSYGDLDVFDSVEFDVGRGERLMILGLNGAGKTSLLRILAGTSEADSGHVHFGHNVTVGYYAQEHEGITAGRTVIEHMREQVGDRLGDEELRRMLGMFALTGEKAFQDASTLSGGEKTKLALAQLVVGRHNLLLLDEPTNNLDPGSRSATAAALASWPGTMVVVSHDTDFVRQLEPDRVLLMPEADLDYWTDDFLELVALA